MISDLVLPKNDAPDWVNSLTEQELDEAIWLLEEREKDNARAGLIPFSQYVDPRWAYWYGARHLRYIASVFERLQRREILRVIINVAPRHGKSSIGSVKFPAKLLGDDPKEKVILASRASNLAVKFSKLVRTTLQTAKYQSLYPDTRIVRGSDSAEDWLLEGGYQSSFRAVGTGGGIAGEGATALLLEDVSDPNKQNSETETEGDWIWYKDVIRSRLEPTEDGKPGIIGIINNRVGDNDVTGHLLDPERNDSPDPVEDWTVVNIPAEAEANDPLGREIGEYLWEERFGREFYEKLKNSPKLWNIQYQQKTTYAEGTLIKREWWEIQLANGEKVLDVVPDLPAGAKWKVRPIDAAFTEKETEKHDPDFTASCKMCFYDGIVWVGEPEEARYDIDALVAKITAWKKKDPQIQLGMGRIAIRAKIIKALKGAGYNITEFPETGDPVAESTGWRNAAAMGLVRLVGTVAVWEKIMEKWTKFPHGHDDTVAMMSIGYDMLGNPLLERKVETRKPPEPFLDDALEAMYQR